MIKIWINFVALLFCLHVSSQTVPVRIIPLNLSQVSVGGYIGDKINACIENRVKAQQVDELTYPFRHREETRYWQTEFWGKWCTSAVAAYQYSKDPELQKVIDKALEQIISSQSGNGYIGNYADTAHLCGWDVWGRKYTLLGLIACYDMTKSKNAIDAAKKLLDFTLTEIGPGKADINKAGYFRGMPPGSILEPVVLLYNRTGEKKYLEFARYIVQQWENPDGPQLISKALQGIPVAERFPLKNNAEWWTWNNGQKAYEMMSCYDGLIELYRVTGEKSYLQATEAAVKNIIDEEINICGSGAARECWYHGQSSQAYQAVQTMETCVTMTWMKLLLNIYKATGNLKYIDQFEISMYNALLGSMSAQGNTFSQYTPLCGFREESPAQPGMKYLHCCLANGPRAVMLIPAACYLETSEGIMINLYTQSKAEFSLNETKLNLEQETDYPKSGKITILVKPEKAAEFGIFLRIPSWSKQNKLTVNNEEVSIEARTGYVELKRRWIPGDKIVLILDMRGRIIPSPDHSKHFIAIMRGPIVLTRDTHSDTTVDADELASPVRNEENYIDLKETTKPNDVWMAFTGQFVVGSFLEGTKGRPVPLTLCDFASAGGGWNSKSRYRVWIPQLVNPSSE
jgi:DUF1680 family protein